MFKLIHNYTNCKFYIFKNYIILDVNINNTTHDIYFYSNTNKILAKMELLNYTDRIIEHNLIIYDNTLDYNIISTYADFVTSIYE